MNLDFHGLARAALGGFKVIKDNNMVESVRRPRLPKTKNRRIRNKWRKKYPQHAMVPRQECYVMGSTIVMHPAVYKALQEYIAETGGMV